MILCVLEETKLMLLDHPIFMNSKSTVASIVSCKLGNKDDFFFWILVCLLLKKILKSLILKDLIVDSSLIKAIPSLLHNLKEIHL
ncbi:hypothetical protein ACS0TY_016475 [Phlomoides rotata]